MKKQCIIFLILIFILGLVPINFSNAADLATKLKGRILLQVESKGEAWYVNPQDGKRYYMADGNAAYDLMRNFGVGITNNNLNKFQSNKTLAIKQSGKIFLQVEDKGQAYYVNSDGKLYYLKDGKAAYNVMRSLGLGISNVNLAKIKTNLDIGDSPSSDVKLVALSNADIIKKVKPGVVYIETADGSGSGMIIDANGYVLTNAHVVAGFEAAAITLYNGQVRAAPVVGRDEVLDIALLKITSGTYSKVDLGNSDLVQQGEEVFTLGFPFGIKGDVSFKEGTISRKLSSDQGGYFETSAEIHPGNSGGPLVDKYGQVIGINSAGLGQSINGVQVGETIKLAIPINDAKAIFQDLVNGRNITVKSQKEIDAEQAQKDAQILEAKKADCKSKSDKMYNDFLVSIESSYSVNDPEVQQLISVINGEEQSIKNSRDSSISDINSSYDPLISQQRSNNENYINSLRVAQMRNGQFGTASGDSQLAQAQADGDQKVASLERQKQSFIDQANASYNQYYQKYEAMRQSTYANLNKQKETAKSNARNNADEYYNKCINE